MTPTTDTTRTSLKFKFLKDLGLEKPSWLPDFGGDKKEEEAPPAPDAEQEDAATDEVVATTDSEN